MVDTSMLAYDWATSMVPFTRLRPSGKPVKLIAMALVVMPALSVVRNLLVQDDAQLAAIEDHIVHSRIDRDGVRLSQDRERRAATWWTRSPRESNRTMDVE